MLVNGYSSCKYLDDVVRLHSISIDSRDFELRCTHIFKIDEPISNIALVTKIDAQVHKVVLSEAALIHDTLQLSLIQLVWNIAEHDLWLVSILVFSKVSGTYGSSDIRSITDAVDIHIIVLPTASLRASTSSRGWDMSIMTVRAPSL
jgi:hypothetical protein